MSTSPSIRDEQLRSIFAQVAPQIDSALVSRYGLPRQGADRVQQELFAWFHRLCRRPGAPASAQFLRPQLISMACRFGHIYWAARAEGEHPNNEAVRRSLSLGPELVAVEIENAIGSRDDARK